MEINLRIPAFLTGEGKKFYSRHRASCIDNGSLTESSHDTFSLMCKLYELMCTVDIETDRVGAMKFNGYLKHYQSLAKIFGLMPSRAPQPKKQNIQDIIKLINQGVEDGTTETDSPMDSENSEIDDRETEQG